MGAVWLGVLEGPRPVLPGHAVAESLPDSVDEADPCRCFNSMAGSLTLLAPPVCVSRSLCSSGSSCRGIGRLCIMRKQAGLPGPVRSLNQRAASRRPSRLIRYGAVAQGESASLAWKRSWVQFPSAPPYTSMCPPGAVARVRSRLSFFCLASQRICSRHLREGYHNHRKGSGNRFSS